ncbi:hypothetical protein [Paraburkholderia sp. SG-MS1]|uniref:hypothetical protein n=1 Tax=Paraburkholderia sp. SG-MS1 TaxID=2023741 RepID=UPI001444D8CD|nr:hypothetical protein [Paraburkholderia sp. SG-MS1]
MKNIKYHYGKLAATADKDYTQMSALRDRDSSEFAARIKVNCERLKWPAGNSLRTPARK